jgi:hypothetical protein
MECFAKALYTLSWNVLLNLFIKHRSQSDTLADLNLTVKPADSNKTSITSPKETISKI